MKSETTDRTELSTQRESRGLIAAFVILLLGALVLYHLSRQDPAELQRRATKLLTDLRQAQEKNPDLQTLLVLNHLQEQESESYAKGMFQHVSLALFVSCFLIVGVEIHSRRAARRDMQRHFHEVTKNVFEGVAQRLLGETMTSELKAILLEDFVKARAGYHITFERAPDDKISDWIIVRLESWYDVRNLTGEPADFPFVTSILGYHKEKVVVDGKQVEFPYFVGVEINGKNVPVSTLQDSRDPFMLKKKILLPKDMSVLTSFKVVTRLLYRTKDSMVFSSSYAMESSEIAISNQVADSIGKCEAVALHKHTEQVTPRTEGKWEFSRALLPGQGWYVCWDRSSTNERRAAQRVAGADKVTITPSENAEVVTMTPSNILEPPTTG